LRAAAGPSAYEHRSPAREHSNGTHRLSTCRRCLAFANPAHTKQARIAPAELKCRDHPGWNRPRSRRPPWLQARGRCITGDRPAIRALISPVLRHRASMPAISTHAWPKCGQAAFFPRKLADSRSDASDRGEANSSSTKLSFPRSQTRARRDAGSSISGVFACCGYIVPHVIGSCPRIERAL